MGQPPQPAGGTLMDALFIALQYLLPQQLLSRLAGRLAECRTSWVKNALIRAFIRRYRVDMTERSEERRVGKVWRSRGGRRRCRNRWRRRPERRWSHDRSATWGR